MSLLPVFDRIQREPEGRGELRLTELEAASNLGYVNGGCKMQAAGCHLWNTRKTERDAPLRLRIAATSGA
jgi:hypothetical protein